ncbi:MAG: hypothetical protein LBU66_05320 [Treponema sp.]|jgi:hypothetical protein|nr:hypothetical protein [Treponema sp.]
MNMKQKNKLIGIIAVLVAVILSLSMTACEDGTKPCSHNWQFTSTTATCEATGEDTFTCKDCQATKKETRAKLEHNHGNTWTKNATNHWKECNCGDKTELAPHDGDPCTVCGYAEGSGDTCECANPCTIQDCECPDCPGDGDPDCEHDFPLTKTPAVEATCTTEGHIEHWKCLACGLLFEDEDGEDELTPEETVISINPDAHISSNCHPYIITGSNGQFRARKGEGTAIIGGSDNQAIATVITRIRTNAALFGTEQPVTIQFGLDNTDLLNIGPTAANATITFEGEGAWGHITLTGRLTGNNASTTTGTIIVNNNVSITSMADIANTANSSRTIYYNSTGELTISGGTVSNAGTGTSYAIYNVTRGTVNIEGGTVSKTNSGQAVRSSSVGRVTVSGNAIVTSSGSAAIGLFGTTATDVGLVITGGTVQNTANTADAHTINNDSSGTVHILGGTISVGSNSSSFAVLNYRTSNNGMLVLGGAPIISGGGGIRSAPGTLFVSNGNGSPNNPSPAFNPSQNYVLNYTIGDYSLAPFTAVTGGAAHLARFALHESALDKRGLAINDGNIEVQIVCGNVNGHDPDCDLTHYTILGGVVGSSTQLTAVKGMCAMGVGAPNQTPPNILTAIREDAKGGDITIQLGNGTSELNIDTYNMIFTNTGTGPDWGLITLTGRITAQNTTITIRDDISINSTADIRTPGANDSRIAISYNSTGTLAINGGTISANLGRALWVSGSGKITIAENAILTTATVNATQGTITLNPDSTATVEIAGGTVRNTAANAASRVIYHNSPTAKLIISGGTVAAAGTTGTATIGQAIHNANTGKITISEDAIISSGNTAADGGTIVIAGTQDAGTRLEITGGTVRNTGTSATARAINNQSTNGLIEISNGLVTAAGIGRAVHNSSTGVVNIEGGTISALATNGYGIWNQAAGTVTIEDGTISAVTAGRAVHNEAAGVVTIYQPPTKLFTGAAGTTYESAETTNKDRTGTTTGDIVWETGD